MKYRWKKGTRLRSDPQKIGEELEQIYQTNQAVTPAAVTEFAKNNPDSLLGQCFEWDVQKAAEARWLDEARYVLRHIVMYAEVDGQEKEVRAFWVVTVPDEDDEKPTTVYRLITDIMDDEEQKAQLIRKARRELSQWQERYSNLREFAAIFSAIDSLEI